MLTLKDLLDPCAWGWFAMVAAAAWNWRKGRMRSALVLAGTVVAISACSLFGVPRRLLAAKEECYWIAAGAQDFEHSLTGAQAVVMCGGVLKISPCDFGGANYNDTVDRFLKAVEVARRLSVPLVLGGGEAGSKNSPFESTFETNWLRSWGLTNLTVLGLGPCHTTHDEAVAAANLSREKGWSKIILVTSGFHMDRALGAFQKAGIKVLPVACDFHAHSQWDAPTRRMLPDADSAASLRLFLCEEVGALYYRFRGWM